MEASKALLMFAKGSNFVAKVPLILIINTLRLNLLFFSVYSFLYSND